MCTFRLKYEQLSDFITGLETKKEIAKGTGIGPETTFVVGELSLAPLQRFS